MSINWYPGHMTKARHAIVALMPTRDVVIEVVDARMPEASRNPAVDEIRGQKPCIRVLSKSDLADPAVTKAWLRHYEGQTTWGKVLAIASSSNDAAAMRAKLPELCKRLAPSARGPGRVVRAMIVGIPNVGKSTLVNTLMNRKVAKVGDEPAVTKSQQQVILGSGIAISDTPGILWPKLEDEAAAHRLALGGAVPDTVIDYESVATFAARYFLERYPELLVARYKLTELPQTPELLVQEIGRRRGCLRSGGVVDVHKAADILLHEFRTGKLGRISLEEPSVRSAPGA